MRKTFTKFTPQIILNEIKQYSTPHNSSKDNTNTNIPTPRVSFALCSHNNIVYTVYMVVLMIMTVYQIYGVLI